MGRPRSRRAVLSLSASALLSLGGCADVGSESSFEAHGDYRAVEITVHSAHPRDVARAVVERFSDLSESQREVVAGAVADGEYVHTTYVEKPLDDASYVAYEDAYYRIGVEIVAERQRTAHLFYLDAISNCEHLHDEAKLETAREEAVAFADLPAADREAFAFTHEDDFREGACFSSGYHYAYESESALERSVLVSEDPTYVEYDGETYLVEFRGTDSVTERDYRYAAERVAETEAQLHDVMVRDVMIDLRPDDLSEAERDLLSELTEVPFERRWENPIPERVDALTERFRSWDSHGGGRYFVRYRGEHYRFKFVETVA